MTTGLDVRKRMVRELADVMATLSPGEMSRLVDWVAARVNEAEDRGRSDRSGLADVEATAMRRAASRGGSIGGPARARKLSPERRKEIAKLAAHSRWEKLKNR